MGVFSKVKDFEKKKAQRKADAMSVVESPSASVGSLAESTNPVPDKLESPGHQSVVQKAKPTSIGDVAMTNNDALKKMTWKNTGIVPMAGQGEYRTEALRDMNEQEFAQNQAKMNATSKEYWDEQVKKDPTSIYAMVNQMFADNETPEEKAKREKRERLGEVFNNLGNLIGNAANLYYTHRGGQYIDLNTSNEKHRARMDAIKAKQDALKQRQDEMLMKYKVADIQAAREAAAKKEEREYEAKVAKGEAERKEREAELKHLRALGVIDAKQANDLEKIKDKYDYDAQLAKIKYGYSAALKGAPTYSDAQRESKVLTSLQGSDGNIYTRNSKLSNEEIRTLAKYVEDWSPYTHVDEDGKETTDYIGALADAAESGAIPTKVLEGMGMKTSQNKKKKTINGFGGESKSNKKTISGF